MRDHSDPHYSLGVSVLLDELETGFDSPAATPKKNQGNGSERRLGSKAVDLDATQHLDYDCTGSWSADTLDGKRPLPVPPPQAARSSAMSTRAPSTDEEADAHYCFAGPASSSACQRPAHMLPHSAAQCAGSLCDLSFTSEQMAELFSEMEEHMDYLEAVEQATRYRGDDLRRELAAQYGSGAVLGLEARLEAQKEAARRTREQKWQQQRAAEARMIAEMAPEQPSADESMLIFSDGFNADEVELLVEGFAILRPPSSSD